VKSSVVQLTRRFDTAYETHKFYTLYSSGSCSTTFFMVKKHVTSHITIHAEPIHISGVCDAYSIYDSQTLFLGFFFETPKKNTRVTPIMLSVKIPPDQDDYVEVQLPPKYGILAYKSSNSSTLIIAQDELQLQYIVRDVI
jgi:hypothetical protein